MTTIVEKVLFLKSIDLFGSLPGEDLAQIAEIAEEVDAEPGDPIIVEGEMGDSLYLVLEGKVRVHKGEKTLVELGERQVVGEMAVLDSEPRSASVTAATPTRLLRIGREDFRDIMAERSEIAAGVVTTLSRRLREANKK